MMFTFTDAVLIACKAHTHQKDKGGEDYIKHPLHLAFKCKEKGYSNEVQITAVLHDVVEDSDITIKSLEAIGCPESVITALTFLTHIVDSTILDKTEEYLRYIERIKTNEIARLVKIEDLLHNSDIRRIPIDKFVSPESATKMQERLWKYATALKILR